MTSGITYTAPRPVNGYEAFEFEIHEGLSVIRVRVSREALEDYVGKRGLPEPRASNELLHYIETYQPEFVQIARQKHQRVESVFISSEDVD